MPRPAEMAGAGPAERERLLALTRAMLGEAAEGRWDALATLESERRRLFSDGAAEDAPAPFLEELLDLNEQLVAAVRVAREDAGQVSQALQAGMRAVSAYDANR